MRLFCQKRGALSVFVFLKSKTFCTRLIHTYHDNRRWFAAIVSYI